MAPVAVAGVSIRSVLTIGLLCVSVSEEGSLLFVLPMFCLREPECRTVNRRS